MKAKTKGVRKGKSTRKRNIAIAATITIMATIIIISALNQQTKKGTNPPKQDPNRYFQFLDVSAVGSKVSETIVRIQYLYFILKPVGGDAHHVVVIPREGVAQPEEYYRDEIKNGTEEHFEIQFQYQIQIHKQDDGYPITLKIVSDEAEGYVTLILKDENIIS
jgi:hypothetical protein